MFFSLSFLFFLLAVWRVAVHFGLYVAHARWPIPGSMQEQVLQTRSNQLLSSCTDSASPLCVSGP